MRLYTYITTAAITIASLTSANASRTKGLGATAEVLSPSARQLSSYTRRGGKDSLQQQFYLAQEASYANFLETTREATQRVTFNTNDPGQTVHSEIKLDYCISSVRNTRKITVQDILAESKDLIIISLPRMSIAAATILMHFSQMNEPRENIRRCQIAAAEVDYAHHNPSYSKFRHDKHLLEYAATRRLNKALDNPIRKSMQHQIIFLFPENLSDEEQQLVETLLENYRTPYNIMCTRIKPEEALFLAHYDNVSQVEEIQKGSLPCTVFKPQFMASPQTFSLSTDKKPGTDIFLWPHSLYEPSAPMYLISGLFKFMPHSIHKTRVPEIWNFNNGLVNGTVIPSTSGLGQAIWLAHGYLSDTFNQFEFHVPRIVAQGDIGKKQ